MMLVMLAAALLMPLLIGAVPPVLDYPNHLARAYLLYRLGQDPLISTMYRSNWAIFPNLGLDLILAGLLHVLPTEEAGRFILAASLLMPLACATIYHRVLFASWSCWSLAIVLVAYNGAFLIGLMNFLLSVGAAFLAAAIWAGMRERRPGLAAALTSAAAIIVFFCHLFGLILLAALMTGHEVDRLLCGPVGFARLLRRLLLAGVVFLAPALLFSLSPAASAHGAAEWTPWFAKPLQLVAPFTNYFLLLDLATAWLVLASIIFAVHRRWLRLPRASAVTLTVLGILYLAAPFAANGAAFLDYRFMIMIGYLIFAGIGEPAVTTWPRTLYLLPLGLFVLRLGLLVKVWSAQPGDVAAMRRVIEPVPPGSRVLVMTVDIGKESAAYWRSAPAVRAVEHAYPADVHLPVLLLAERQALAQSLFADPSQQPIVVLPAFAGSAQTRAAAPVPVYRWLRSPLRDVRQSAYPYLEGWQQRFDYVLIVNAGGLPDPKVFLPDQLELVRLAPVLALFRVRHPD